MKKFSEWHYNRVGGVQRACFLDLIADLVTARSTDTERREFVKGHLYDYGTTLENTSALDYITGVFHIRCGLESLKC